MPFNDEMISSNDYTSWTMPFNHEMINSMPNCNMRLMIMTLWVKSTIELWKTLFVEAWVNSIESTMYQITRSNQEFGYLGKPTWKYLNFIANIKWGRGTLEKHWHWNRWNQKVYLTCVSWAKAYYQRKNHILLGIWSDSLKIFEEKINVTTIGYWCQVDMHIA